MIVLQEGLMRLASCLFSLLLLTGITAAQDTNFSVGPQYLVTSSSPMFLRPIATPSLSLSTPMPSPSAPPTEALPEPSSPFAGAPPQPDLTRIFWGEPASESPEPPAENEIEITSAQPSQPLPASIVDPGVTSMTTAQSLRIWGFGAPLGETASFWKTHGPHASRRYTNADVQRLHPS
jgi:hypothetical protein